MSSTNTPFYNLDSLCTCLPVVGWAWKWSVGFAYGTQSFLLSGDLLKISAPLHAAYCLPEYEPTKGGSEMGIVVLLLILSDGMVPIAGEFSQR